MFDLSGNPQDLEVFDFVNKKVIGKIKDDFMGNTISEFVAFKSKMYSLTHIDNEGNKKAKAVNKNVARSKRHEEYIDDFFYKKLIIDKIKRTQSKL